MSDVTYPHSPMRDTTVRDDTTYVSAMLKRTNWGAVIAGAVTAISLQILFSVLGIAIGATTTDVTGTNNDGEGISIAAGLWWLVTGTISLFIGGCVVGRFSGMVRSPDVLLHAFVMWAVTAIFGFAVVSSGTGMALDKAVDSYWASNMSRSAGFPMSPDGRPDRVIRTADTNIATETGAGADTGANAGKPGIQDNSAANNLDERDLEQARRIVRNTSWWSLVALLIGIGVSLGGAWSTAPHRIVVRPTTAHD